MILDKYITKLDIIFAKAYFGYYFFNSSNDQKNSIITSTTDAVIPIIKNDGTISINNFIHPILAFTSTTKEENVDDLVPIKLELSKEEGKSILIISGPNGGGKTLTLKSFGLVCLMMKLAIPIPVLRDDNNNDLVQIDYFDNIFTDIGDHQNVLHGESTFMSKLNSYSRIIKYMTLIDQGDDDEVDNTQENSSNNNNNVQNEEVQEHEHQEQHSLILLDELASGSDERMASSLGQSLLEYLLHYSGSTNNNNGNYCRLVTTTHSSSIKTMSLYDDRFNCASMSIYDDDDDDDDYNNINDNSINKNDDKYYYKYQMNKKKPAYKVLYGKIGQSYAFNAASHRCNPPLPKELLYRAYNIYDDNDNNDDNTDSSKIPTLMESLEVQKKKLEIEMNNMQEQLLDIEKMRNSTYLLAKSYENKLSSYDTRLQHIISHLDTNNSNNNKNNAQQQEYQYKVIGKTISELRLIKQHINNDIDNKNKLKEKGLKIVSPTYSFYDGESVIIIKQNDALEGIKANVVINNDNENDILKDEVRIIPSFQWQYQQDDIMNNGYNDDNNNNSIIVKRKDLAIWDYNDNDNGNNDNNNNSIRNKQDKLFLALNQIQTTTATATATNNNNNNRKTQSTTKTNSKYVSARERKAAMKSKKKKKK